MDAATVGWLTLATVLSMGVIHEVLHIFSAHELGYLTRVTPRFYRRVVPYALAVDLEKDGKQLTGTWKSWDAATKAEYTDIAITPYLFIVPFCVFLLLTHHPVLMMWSTGIIAWHFINYPLEWIIV